METMVMEYVMPARGRHAADFSDAATLPHMMSFSAAAAYEPCCFMPLFADTPTLILRR